MSEPENFIARWARRKAAAQDAEASPAAPAAAATGADSGEGDCKQNDPAPALGRAPESSTAAFDPASLPPIESITAETDIRAFLAPGVPAQLTRAALRRAWASDPKIRDFVGLSENSWDFNAPGAIAGFGPLEMTDELRAQVARMLGGGVAGEAPKEAPAQAPPPEMPRSSEGTAELPDAAPEMTPLGAASTAAPPSDEGGGKPGEQARSESLPHRNKSIDSARCDPQDVDDNQLIARRLHGGALPK
ncbi:MAG TPA: DUF3306 domain-containing protein [Xanthobacteraceae bacterium]|nr:DUF3306 domain-containing protein [Xanthobacteraceae bacterium]